MSTRKSTARRVTQARGARGGEIRLNEEVINQLRDIVQETLTPITQRLGVLEHNLTPVPSTSNSSEVEMLDNGGSGSAEAYCGPTRKNEVIMVNNPTKPTFNGEGIHPVVFLEELQKYFSRVNVSPVDFHAAVDCLTGNAKNWAKIYIREWKTYEDFKKGFLGYYWGREAQNKVRRRISSGKWNEKLGLCMSDYFSLLFAESQRLTSYLNEEETVDEIMQHFPLEIRRLWYTNGCKGPISASQFLKNVEGASGESCLRPQTHQKETTRPGKHAGVANIREGYEQGWQPAGREAQAAAVEIEDDEIPEEITEELN